MGGDLWHKIGIKNEIQPILNPISDIGNFGINTTKKMITGMVDLPGKLMDMATNTFSGSNIQMIIVVCGVGALAYLVTAVKK